MDSVWKEGKYGFRFEYNTAVGGVMSRLVETSEPHGLTFVGELQGGWNFSPKMDIYGVYF